MDWNEFRDNNGSVTCDQETDDLDPVVILISCEDQSITLEEYLDMSVLIENTVTQNEADGANMLIIDTLLHQAEEAAERRSSLMSSIAWSYAFSLANQMTYVERLGLTAEDGEGYMDRIQDDARDEHLLRAEQRIDEIRLILAWASSNALPDYLPSGEQVYDMMTASRTTSEIDTVSVAEFAAMMGISPAKAKAIYLKTEKTRAEAQKLNAGVMARIKQSLVHAVDAGITAQPPQFLELSLLDSIRIATRIADKCEQYMDKVLELAQTKTRRKVLADLAAQKTTLEKLADEADEITMRFEKILASQGPQSTEE